MMKNTRMIFGKYWRRGFSSIASSPMSSRVKQGWAEQNGLGLVGVFIGGWCIHACINVYKRREHWYRVDRLSKENDKRFTDLMTRYCQHTMAMNEATLKRLMDMKKNRVDSD
ncbi:hypothetical protein HA466_0223020 [Hirschfeldia incana]|nr:hypothetical protein HA466_0223020 [Hirschfeldia incana]